MVVFLEYLEMGWIKQVDLYDNSRNAIVQASSPELGWAFCISRSA